MVRPEDCRPPLTQSVSGGQTRFHVYDAFGRSETISVGAQVIERYGFDGWDRMVRHQQWTAAGAVTSDRQSVFDAFDRVTSQKVTAGTGAAVDTRFTTWA